MDSLEGEKEYEIFCVFRGIDFGSSSSWDRRICPGQERPVCQMRRRSHSTAQTTKKWERQNCCKPPNGVPVRLNLTKATPGTHAFHVHAVGKCEGPEFTTAGGHFNPTSKKHGLLSKEGSHTGDLPNIVVPDSGALTVETVIPHVTLKAGDHTLADANGSALVLHAGEDDLHH